MTRFLRVIAALLTLFALPLAAACGYLLLLTLASRRTSAPAAEASRKLQVVVPAHDEEKHIEGTVERLSALDYPRGLFRVLVVADNCRDATAALARGAGAEVIERHDAERRGKGYALEYAFGRAGSASGSASARRTSSRR